MRFPIPALSISIAALVASTASAGWTVTLLEPAGAGQSKAFGAYGGRQCGFANFTGQGTATIWQGTSASCTVIGNSSWLSSAANAMSGDQVVVSAQTMMMGHAQLYSIQSGTYVTLTPSGYQSSAGAGCDVTTNSQVGGGAQMMGSMLLWHGTAESAVNLTPPGWASSAGAACAGDSQVGNGFPGFMGFGHPFITHGTAASYVDLTPPGSTSAGVAGCDANQQIGSVKWPAEAMGHACTWTGTAESCIDLHPAFAASSAGQSCRAGMQVGNYVGLMGGFGKAVVWHGTAASAEDLHQYVTADLGSLFIASEAMGIDPLTGDIVGNAYTTDGMFMIPHAVLWHNNSGSGADLNNDGVVNGQDVTFLFAAWGGNGAADLNGDGTVDGQDLGQLLAAWTV